MKMSIANAALFLAESTAQGITDSVLCWGAPGIGKSSMARQMCDRMEGLTGNEYGFIDVRLSQLDPVDLRGVPAIDETNTTIWARPSFLPTVETHGAFGFLVLDEIFLGAQSTQAAGMQLVLDRTLGDYVLPEGWRILAFSNRPEDRAGVNGSPNSALLNRFQHLEIVLDQDAWAAWAASAGIDPMLIAFIRFRPHLLHQFPDGGIDKGLRAFATPRTWEMASRVLSMQNLTEDVMHEAVAGCVGHGAASEAIGFIQMCQNLPSMKSLLADPEGCSLPREPSTQYAIACNLAANATAENFGDCLTICRRMSDEFAVIMVRDAIARDESLTACKGYIDATVELQNVMFN